MVFEEIIGRCESLRIDETRKKADGYHEFVIFKSDIGKWNAVFTDFFGDSIKPQGVKPSKYDLKLTQDHGGITKEQVLFRKSCDDGSVIAMLWPWQDDVHITLKIAHMKMNDNFTMNYGSQNDKHNPTGTESRDNGFLSVMRSFFKK